MVAEVQLYWITYVHCTQAVPDTGATDVALRSWRAEWEFLFGKTCLPYLPLSRSPNS